MMIIYIVMYNKIKIDNDFTENIHNDDMVIHWEKCVVFYDGYLGVLVGMGIQERAHLLEIEKIRIKNNSDAYTGLMVALVTIPHFAYLREAISGMSSLLGLIQHSTNAR